MQSKRNKRGKTKWILEEVIDPKLTEKEIKKIYKEISKAYEQKVNKKEDDSERG